jgi:hypothetical protein
VGDIALYFFVQAVVMFALEFVLKDLYAWVSVKLFGPPRAEAAARCVDVF